MQGQDSFYPVRITSRAVAKKRSRRISWFVVGTGFGVLTTFLTAPSFSSSFWTAPGRPIEQASTDVPVTTGINVTAIALTPQQVAQNAPAPAPAPVAKISYPLSMNVRVEEGDTLNDILNNIGISQNEATRAITAIHAAYNPKKLIVGQNIALTLNQDPKAGSAPIITNMKLPVSATSMLEVSRRKISADANFNVKKIGRILEHKLAHASGRIDSSLYETGGAIGLPVSVLSNLINAYSYDVDFQREVQPGDTVDVLFERLQTKEGANAGTGDMIYAELNLSGKSMKIYRYVDKSGSVSYYNEKGESVRKALLRTPINGAKITSGYGMRNHPLLGYSKMHRGVDFGAPTGTPIYASGDGTIAFLGQKGGYGNYLRIHHNTKYDSAYAHISRFAEGVHQGSKVKQGQVVAYVGATGMATGPHLHYEILVNNEQVNPASVKFKTGDVLAGKELASFRKNMEKIQAQLNDTSRKTNLAMADAGK